MIVHVECMTQLYETYDCVFIYSLLSARCIAHQLVKTYQFTTKCKRLRATKSALKQQKSK